MQSSPIRHKNIRGMLSGENAAVNEDSVQPPENNGDLVCATHHFAAWRGLTLLAGAKRS
jgi:hypothetical protein